jgi:glycosyltransferase involved in cell wall biosynthesis
MLPPLIPQPPTMKILFLDQSGKLGGAELSLLDVAAPYRHSCLVGLFQDGPYRERLEQEQIPVQVLSKQSIQIHKDSGLWQSLSMLWQLIPLLIQVAALSYQFEVIYANTQKAFVVGTLASLISRRPVVYHLRDILSKEHFSRANLTIAIVLANWFTSLVIANSHATRQAFIDAGGNPERVKVVYNGFQPERYQVQPTEALRQQLKLENRFVVGHFSRLSPWKGQHILIEALLHCPPHVVVLLIGDALFGEQAYVKQLLHQVASLELQDRVLFLGFRSDVPQLMALCDLITHTSTSPEPFGRVIIEAMLCGTPIIASQAGGAVELIEHGKTGWLAPPGDPLKLAQMVALCCQTPDLCQEVAALAQSYASQSFHLSSTNRQIEQLLSQVIQNGRRAFTLSKTCSS